MFTIAPLALAALLTLAADPEPPEALPATTPPPTSESREFSRITLHDGQVLRGWVAHQDERAVVVELTGGSRLELPADSVKSVELETRARVDESGELRFEDPNRTRYLYAPSAMMLRKGEGYFSQKMLFFSSVAYGVNDFVTVQAGAILPAWLAPDGTGLNFIGGLKVGGEVVDRLHLSAGAQLLVIPFLGNQQPARAAGFLFGTATYGTPDAHVSLSAGTPLVLARDTQALPGNLILTASGNLRVSKSLALVTENWLIPDAYRPGSEPPMLNSLAVRFFGERWAVDVGGIRVPGLPIPIPWLDFTYNFGG
jgi:hypothetical protein